MLRPGTKRSRDDGLDRDWLIEWTGVQVHAACAALDTDLRIFSIMCLAIARMKSGGTLLPIWFLHRSCFAGQWKSGLKLPMSAISSIVSYRGVA
jgi:hypothetical protein